MARKPGLGKGLNALIPPAPPPSPGTPESEGGPLQVPINKIVPNPRQPRHTIHQEGLAELAASIREHGIIQPLIVTHEPQTDQFILIAGERRLNAAMLAGLENVPVVERRATEQERLEIALIENVQRADLTPLETAHAYHELNNEFHLSHEEIATRVGKSRVAITNTLRLLKLPETVRQALAEEKISEGHARALLGLTSAQAQAATLETIFKQGLSVRQTEQLVRKLNGIKPPSKPAITTAPEITAIEERLRDRLGTKVNVRHGKKGGSVIIHYYSNEELETIVSQISGD